MMVSTGAPGPNGTTRTWVHLVEETFARSRGSWFENFCNTGEDGTPVTTRVLAGARRRNRLPETTTVTVAGQWGQEPDLPNKILRGPEGPGGAEPTAAERCLEIPRRK